MLTSKNISCVKASNNLNASSFFLILFFQVTWNDVRDFLDNELRDRPFEPHELLMKLRFIDETSSGYLVISTYDNFSNLYHKIYY
uniref:T-ag OBD domain-containing protein n=1 Tax=Heterorhabditis bacteriophora TaxID=37862 RepID=A0A1I7XEN9_HETBA